MCYTALRIDLNEFTQISSFLKYCFLSIVQQMKSWPFWVLSAKGVKQISKFIEMQSILDASYRVEKFLF